MALSNDLASQFVKATMDVNKENNKESTIYGKVVKVGDKEYVQLDGSYRPDGSELLTPISSTTTVNDNDRVMVVIKNHEAIVTGNLTDKSASSNTVKEISNKITEFEIIVADKVVTEDLEAINAYIENIKGITAKYKELEAITAEIETLQAKYANMQYITANDANIINAEIESLKARVAEFQSISTEDLEAINAEFTNLIAYNASFTYLSADKLQAINADIKNLKTDKLDVENGKIHFAQIDFANVSETTIDKMFVDYGVIKKLQVSEGTFVKELVGVTIKGDLIETGTLKADKLIVLGEDGLYYKLNVNALGEATASSDPKYQNGLDGTAILAESITADRIIVDDLSAFGADIGGFHITEDSLYSGNKVSKDSDSEGVYLDTEGQMVIGDNDEYIKYIKGEKDKYAVQISAKDISIRSYHEETIIDEETGKETIASVSEDINLLDTVNNVKNIEKSVETKISPEEASIIVKTEIDQYGTSKVVTKTGFTFNDEGLTISKTGKEMSTNIDEDGMSIFKNNEEVLTADNQGVNAYNLHAKTYLIIGNTSRFEDFTKNGKKRTGCFWIG